MAGERKLQGEIDIITKDAEANINRLDRKLIELNAQLKRTQQDTVLDPKVKTKKVDALNKRIDSLKLNINAIKDVNIEITAGKNIDRVQKQIAKIKFDIETVSNIKLDPQVKADKLQGLGQRLEFSNTQLKLLQGKKINLNTGGATKKVNLFTNAIKKSAKGVGNLSEKMTGFASSMGAAGGVLLGVAAGFVAFVSGANKAANEMAKLEAGTNNYLEANKVLTSAGGIATSTDFINEMKNALGGAISKADALRVSNNALLFGVAKSPEQYGKLANAAAILGQSVGVTAAQAIEDLTLALGRGSPKILDNLGIQLKLGDAHKRYAKQIGKTVAQLTEQDRQTAFVVIATKEAIKKAKQLGGENSLVVNSSEQLAASWSDFSLSVGNLVKTPISAFLGEMAEGFNKLTDGAEAWVDVMERAPSVFNQMVDEITLATDGGLNLFGDSDNIKVQTAVIEADIARITEMLANMSPDDASYKALRETLKLLQEDQINAAKELNNISQAGGNRTFDQNSEAVKAGNAEFQKRIQLQKDAAKQADADTKTREQQLKKFQSLEKRGFITRQKLVQLTLNKEMTVAERQVILEQELQSAREQMHVRRLDMIDEVAAKESQMADLQSVFNQKQTDAVASFQKRRDEFYANEGKRIKDLQEQGLKGKISGLLGDLSGELGSLFGQTDEGGISRQIGEQARRLAAVAGGEIDGHSANLLKESGFWEKIFGSETDPALIQQKAMAVGQQLINGFDEFGIVDVSVAADRVINMVLGESGPSLEDAIFEEIKSRNVLTPEQLNEAFGITKQDFSEELDLSLVGTDEIEQIKELQTEIEKMGTDGMEDIDALAKATDGVNESSENWILTLDEIIARLDQIKKDAGTLDENYGMFSSTGGGAVASGEASATIDVGGGNIGQSNTAPVTPNAGLITPSAFSPNLGNAVTSPSTTQNTPISQNRGNAPTTTTNNFTVIPYIVIGDEQFEAAVENVIITEG